jgi:hypothetical protein
MINAKVKIIERTNSSEFESEVNKFLKTIDIKQIVKTEFSTTTTNYHNFHTVMIYYVNIEDVREAKIDNILEIK